MNTARKSKRVAIAMLAAGASLFLPLAVRAETLSFTRTPASNAVAEMDRRYGVSIVFRSAVNSTKPITFSIDNADTPDGRLQAINALANALNMDFQKVYVVSKIDPGTTVPDVKIDNDGPIVFPATKVSAREAIRTITGVDGALAEISGAITGSVVFPSRHTTAAAAAAAVARQTGTVWHAYYGFFKHGEEPSRLKGDVLGTDINGNPVTALPLVSFRNQISTPAPYSEGAVPPPTLPVGVLNVTSVANISTDLTPGFGFSPYGYPGFNAFGSDYGNPYGYGSLYGSPYGYGGLGYTDPNGGFAFPGTIYSPGQGTAPVLPGVNAPGVIPPGSTVTTVPNTSTILPDFPVVGNGGFGSVGGY